MSNQMINRVNRNSLFGRKAGFRAFLLQAENWIPKATGTQLRLQIFAFYRGVFLEQCLSLPP